MEVVVLVVQWDHPPLVPCRVLAGAVLAVRRNLVERHDQLPAVQRRSMDWGVGRNKECGIGILRERDLCHFVGSLMIEYYSPTNH